MSDPRSDRIFKQIFHHHPSALIHLLNTFLPLQHPIESIEYLPSELQAEIDGLSMSIVDVRCRDRKGRHFIVEMQIQKTAYFEQRVMLNAYRLYTRQMKPGGNMEDLYPVYALCLLDHILFDDHPNWIHHVQPMTGGSPHIAIKGVTLTFVEIRKWEKLGKMSTFGVEKHEDAWMLFFTQPEKVMGVLKPEQLAELDGLITAVNAWDLSTYSEWELLIMEHRMDRMLSHKMVLESMLNEAAKEGAEKVLELGLEVGFKDGVQQGMKRGMNNLLSAISFMKEHPETQDNELIDRFELTSDALRLLRDQGF
jgi:predicted transposase/invertase (TIGR01784 family)